MALAMKPVVVEVLAYAPSEFYHCTHCEVVFQQAGIGPKVHAEQRSSALPPDLQDQYQAIAQWAHDLHGRYGDSVVVKPVDAASIEGFIKSLRYWRHRYPAFILDGSPLPAGSDLRDVAARIGVLIGDSAEGG